MTLSNSEESIERQYHHFKERYEKLKSDVTVKLRLLTDNRVRKLPQYPNSPFILSYF